MYIFLNYPITNSQKYYNGSRCYFSYVDNYLGDKFNRETLFEFNSHMGTHIDFPAHFFKLGRFGDSYPPEYFVVNKVVCAHIDLLNGDSERLTADHFQGLDLPADVEFLLIKTGFSAIRTQDQYWQRSPVIESSVPLYLRDNFNNLKFVGFDIVSLTSQLDKVEGALCHKNFLSSDYGDPLLVVEDMDLNCLHQRIEIETIHIAPLLFENMDGSPCTVFAKIRNPEEETC